MSNSWLEELEARLEQQLEGFLRTNPQQEELLREQEGRERQQRLLGERVRLRQQAEDQRQELLRLADEIRQWQGRIARARAAGAEALAGRAEAHVATLMNQGRHRWQALADLGQRFTGVEAELAELVRLRHSRAASTPDLEADWARFEAQQELQELKRRQQR
ncbi:hercynine metabolism protein [Synechococcus sp. CCY 9618]|uniref:hercynine metabolism protein n=1 Tax=Synechococcus sp. CCY 9618 TaxID=2815602 RepID=UPI001C225995|nr:hercynine metabolism protein [Synechococcus sp. CCY 9618]